MANELEAVMEENKKLKEDRAIEQLDESEEGKLDIHEQLDKYRKETKSLEAELQSVKRSRDSLQNENAELKKTTVILEETLPKI